MLERPPGLCTTAVTFAVSMGDPEWLQFLINHGANPDPGCALVLAARMDRPDLVRILLQAGAQVDADDSSRFRSALASAVACAGLETIRALMDAGADVAKRLDGDVVSAVATAALRHREDVSEVVSLLASHGADVSLVGGTHGSALGEACGRKNMACLKALIEAGARVNQPLPGTSYGSALDVAAATGDMPFEILIEAGADANLRSETGAYGSSLAAAASHEHLACVQALLLAGADANQVLLGGSFGSGLVAAAKGGNLDCLLALIGVGADVNQPLDAGNMAPPWLLLPTIKMRTVSALCCEPAPMLIQCPLWTRWALAVRWQR